ncbi:MAG: hypothetical protein ACI4MG_10690 [Aristaeellaceae bacterium]
MNRMKKLFSLILSMMLMMLCLYPASAASEPTKEEVIYAALDADGRSGEVYVVNIFPGGVVTDYGNYTSVRMMNTEDAVTYVGGLVSFVSADSRVYYQGNMAHAELPWLFEVTWKLNGQPVAASQMAGASGAMELHLATRRNPACSGDFFDTHTLQITASLDTEKCRNIAAEGATQANVGSMRQMNWIVLPGMEADITLTADVADFEMSALSMAGVRMQLDPGEEVIADVLELADGLEELSSHNTELTDGAKQLVQAVFDAANAELQASKADFDRLGITLNELTMENYDEEITRLQAELLDKVDEYVLRQAEQQLRSQIYGAAAGMVRSEVEKAARAQVEQEVRKAAEQQVRDAVTAEARNQVEAAVRNPSDADIDTLVDTQMQTAEVQAMIDANVEVQMASPEVQAQISAEIENTVRPQVEAAVEAEVRRQVEAAVRQSVRDGLEKTMEAKIRVEVRKEMEGDGWPSVLPDVPDATASLVPTFNPAAPAVPTPAPAGSENADPAAGQPGAATVSPTGEATAAPTGLPSLGDLLEGLPSIPTHMPTETPAANGFLGTAAEPPEPSTEVTNAGRTPAPTESPLLHDLLDGLLNPGANGYSSGEPSALPPLPSLDDQSEEPDRTTWTDLISLLIPSAKAEDSPLSLRIEEEVAARMASPEVQQQIDALTDVAMASDTTQALIDAQVESRMQSPEVQAIIDAEVAAQVANPDNRAQAEAAAREEVRRQVEVVAREQVRAAIIAQLNTMTEEEVNAMVDQQMQSATVQQMIEDEVAVQMATAQVQAMIDAEVENQMGSAEVQALIEEECAKQMVSDEVQHRISSEMQTHRNSSAYLNQVSDALEANGENGEAYQALVTLRETLDDVMRFYDGMIEYTDGVAEAAEGVSNARTEVRAMLGDGNDRETMSFASEKNGAVRSVQFVLSVPAIEKDDEPVAEQDEPADGTLVDKLLRLFH